MATTRKSKTTKSKAAQSPKAKSKSRASSSRCWPGYEPTPGKKPFAKGSCHKK